MDGSNITEWNEMLYWRLGEMAYAVWRGVDHPSTAMPRNGPDLDSRLAFGGSTWREVAIGE